MQKAAFITGTSRGIGKAIAEILLEYNYIVFGYSRTNTITHQHFTHVKINLSNLKEIQDFSFPRLKTKQVLLINNAATIGSIAPLHLKKEEEIVNEYNINIIAPTILCSKFLNAFKNEEKIMLNISSGASNNSIASWSVYCATKSALDRLTDVIAKEQHKGLNIFSIHPGVINTKMQEEIRNVDNNLFPSLQKYINYFMNEELEDANIVAQKLYYIIINHAKFSQNILSIRKIKIN